MAMDEFKKSFANTAVARLFGVDEINAIIDNLDINPASLPPVPSAFFGPSSGPPRDPHRMEKVKVMLFSENTLLPASLEEKHVTMTLSVHENDRVPDLPGCIDPMPVYVNLNRSPTLFWVLVSITGDDEGEPDVVSVRYKTLEELHEDAESDDIAQALSHHAHTGFDPVAIFVTYREIKKHGLQPAPFSFRDEICMEIPIPSCIARVPLLLGEFELRSDSSRHRSMKRVLMSSSTSRASSTKPPASHCSSAQRSLVASSGVSSIRSTLAS